MKTTYYPEDDILVIHLGDKDVTREESYGWNVNISYAENGDVTEIVILEATAKGFYPVTTDTKVAYSIAKSCRSRISIWYQELLRTHNI